MTFIRWAGTAFQIIGVFALSTRLMAPTIAFGMMTTGSLAWAAAGLRMRDWALVGLNAAFTASNIIGIWRWSS